MLEAVEGELCLLEVSEAIRCMLFCMLEVMEMMRWHCSVCWRLGRVSSVAGGAGGDTLLATLYAGGDGGDATCAALYAGGCGGWALFAGGAGGDTLRALYAGS